MDAVLARHAVRLVPIAELGDATPRSQRGQVVVRSVVGKRVRDDARRFSLAKSARSERGISLHARPAAPRETPIAATRPSRWRYSCPTWTNAPTIAAGGSAGIGSPL